MDHIDVSMADTRIIADDMGPERPGDWDVRISDAHSGKRHRTILDYKKLGIILYLLMNGDDDMPGVKELYPVAEEIVKDWPKECRPMP